MTEPKNVLEPLAPELLNLISAAKSADTLDAETTDRLYRRLAGTLALPLLPPVAAGGGSLAAKTAASVLTGKTLIVAGVVSVGIGFAAAVGLNVYQGGASQPSVTRPVETIVPPMETATEAAVEETVPPSDTDTVLSVESDAESSPKNTRRSAEQSMAAERLLIETAREALRKGRPNEAAYILQQHKKRYARGRFLEEREALDIMALSALGHRKQAQKQADRFITRYPESMFVEAVNAALKKGE
jgi:hypothetical protein